MYSGTYNGWRFSRLNQITPQNVKNLRVKWLFQGRHNEKFETTPLVVDGIMYLTRPENAIYALDAVTGRQLWMYEHRNPERTFNCCGRNNRGLAILGTTLFMNTLDMHVVAVDAKSGLRAVEDEDVRSHRGRRLRGDRRAARRERQGDRRHGRRRARRQRIPRRLRRENGSACSGASTRFRSRASRTSARGPAIRGKPEAPSTWNTGSYDPDTNTLFWGTSNPWPDYFDDNRAGDNLYSASVLALDPDTGKLKWYYQFTPHDVHDWDSTQNPVLVDTEFLGQTAQGARLAESQRVLLSDRSHQRKIPVRHGVREADVERRLRLREQRPAEGPARHGPDAGRQRESVAGHRRRGQLDVAQLQPADEAAVYVFAREERRAYTKNEACSDPHDRRAAGKGQQPQRCSAAAAAVAARRDSRRKKAGAKRSPSILERATIKWEHKVLTPPWGGLMSTAGNLVFGGTHPGSHFCAERDNRRAACGRSRATARSMERRSAISPTASSSCRFRPATSS